MTYGMRSYETKTPFSRLSVSIVLFCFLFEFRIEIENVRKCLRFFRIYYALHWPLISLFLFALFRYLFTFEKKIEIKIEFSKQ